MPTRPTLLAACLALLAAACGGSDDASAPAHGAAPDASDASDAATADPAIGAVEVFAHLTASSEGIAFGPGPDGETTLYVGTRDGHVVRVAKDGAVANHVDLPSPVGIALAADGALVVCGEAEGGDAGGGTVIWRVTPAGEKSVLVDGGATPFQQTNFVAVAPDGSLLFSDSGADRLYRADADGKNLAVVADPLSFANGITFSQDGATAYVASWDQKKVWSFPFHAGAAYGAAALFSDDVAAVDGLATFASGDLLYVATSEGLVRYGLDHAITRLAPAAAIGIPANGAFGVGAYGEGWVYVTNLFDGTLARVWVGEGGAPLPAR